MLQIRKTIAAIVVSALLAGTLMPVATAYAQGRNHGAYSSYQDDYRNGRNYDRRHRNRYRDSYRDEREPRVNRRRSRSNRRAEYARRDVRPARQHATPDYSAIARKKKRKKRIRKIIAIGAGILALGIIARAASKR